MKILRCLLLCLLGITAEQQAGAQSAPTVVLDSFESGSIRVINPGETDPAYKYLWSQYEGGCSSTTSLQCLGTTSVANTAARDGAYSLNDHVTQANAYLQFYPYSDAYWGWGWMHDFLASGTWKQNTYNRMRLWVKVPAGFSAESSADGHNLELGTYVRASDCGDYNSSEECGGNHYYHFYNIPQTTEWYQIILDAHPTHQRGASGSIEWGDQPYPTCYTSATPGGILLGGSSHVDCGNWNYFDALTRFYLDFYNDGYVLPTVPGDFYFDGFELYQESNPVNVQQVYSLGGVYVPASNRIHIGWQHPKNDGTTCHDVRYAFQDVFTLGWANATPAPFGTVCPTSDVYAGMVYDTTGINVSGQGVIYIAIKPENSSSFNQIVVPLSNVPVSITAPSSGSLVSGSSVNVSANASTGTAAVQFQLDGANLGAQVTAAPFATPWNTATSTNASHKLTALAFDRAGNSTASAAVSVTVDNVPPTISLSAPAAGSTISGTVTVSVNASDNVAVASVQFQLDGTNLGAPVTSSPYSVSWNTTAVSNGSHVLAAVARDTAGNQAVSSAVTITVNNAPPSVSITSPATGVTVSGTITVSAAASGSAGLASVQFQLDGAALGSLDTASPYSVSWNTAVSADGSHTLTAVVTDTIGNKGTSAPITVNVNNNTTTAPPPTTTNTSASTGAVAFIQGNATTNDNNSGQVAQKFTTDTIAGDLIVAAVSWGDNASVTCQDSQGNVYKVATTQFDQGNNQALAICYASNIKGGPDTITATFTDSTPYRRLLIHEYAGIALTGPVDVVAEKIGNGSAKANAITSGNAKSTANGELVFGAVMDDTGVTKIAPGLGFAPRQSVAGDLFSEDLVQASAGTTAATFTFSAGHRYLAEMVIFKHK